MKHVVNVIILIVVATFLLLLVVNSIDWMPFAASAEAGPIDWLFGLHLDVITFFYVLVNGILLYSVIVFRRKKDDEGEGAYFHSNTGLEIGWTIIPLIIVMVFAVLGAVVLKQTTEAAPNEIEIGVTARQWSWSFEYPDLGEWNAEYTGERVASTEMNVPVNHQVKLVMTSEDVTHSFWVPEFRLKQDLVPGRITTLLITPTEIGQYKVRCAELCGTSHAYMLANVNVMSEKDFDIWIQKRLGIYTPPPGETETEGGEATDPATLGAQVVQNAGCTACHSVDGSTLVGPSWKGLLNRTETLDDGSTVTADEDYIHESIVDPAAKIVEGFAGVMPNNYGDILTPDEIDAIIAYIKTLQ